MKSRFLIAFIAFLGFTSCTKYLDLKTDLKKKVPTTLADAEALLNNYAALNQASPYVSELCSDNFMMTEVNYNGITILEDRLLFVWDKVITPPTTQWANSYKKVYIANQVLSIVQNFGNDVFAQELKGRALFFRALAHFDLATLFMDIPKADGSNQHLMGIPYRKTPNLEDLSERITMKQYFAELLQDLLVAKDLLPVNTTVVAVPSRNAVNALLANIYIYMQQYELADTYASACLTVNSDLMDFQTLPKNSNTPIQRFNKEVIFQSVTVGSQTYSRGKFKVSTDLVNLYESNDLRRDIFLLKNSDGTYSFKGNYDGQLNQAPFNGYANDEMYLIRAETRLRKNDVAGSLADINTLLKNRYDNTFIPLQENDKKQLMRRIINERRKELIMRQRRWMDLKRFNLESDYATTLNRTIGPQVYSLKPNEPGYILLIPTAVIENSNLKQTQR